MKSVGSIGTTGFLAAMAVLVALLPVTPPARAADETRNEFADVADQLAGIRDELRAIVRLLGTVEEHQRVTALMTRIRLKQQRLSSLESDLRAARKEQEGAEQEIARLTAMEENWGEQEGERFTDEGLSEEERRGLEMMRQERKSLASRVETLRLRIVELENDLARAQNDIQTLEETVDEQLGLR